MKPKFWFAVSLFSMALLMASLWQVEIVAWNQDEFFEFPFFLIVINKWWARDFWYAVNMASWIMAFISGCKLRPVLEAYHARLRGKTFKKSLLLKGEPQDGHTDVLTSIPNNMPGQDPALLKILLREEGRN